MTTPHCFSWLVVKKGLFTELKLDCAYIAKKKKRKERKKWQELTRRRCFISVISTGYKLYFYQFWLMWSCLREEKKKTPWMNKFPSWTQVGLLSQLPDLSHFFVYLFCLFMQRLMWWMNTLFKLQGCLGERLSTRKWAENPTAGSVSRQTPDFRLQCIVYCIWNCRVSTYCIYY